MSAPPPRAIAVTGSSGFIGSKLLERLERAPGLHKLVAFDTAPLTAPIHNIAAYRQDVSEPVDEQLTQHRVETLVHLAYTRYEGARQRQPAELRARNLAALRGVLESCQRAHIGHLVYLSSAAVYGARPDLPVPVTEDDATPEAPQWAAAYDQQQAELLLREFQQSEPGIRITVLRCCPVLGMRGGAYPPPALFAGRLLSPNHQAPLQFLYDEDLARVICAVTLRRIPGLFNVAGPGVVYPQEAARIIGRRAPILPGFLADGLLRLGWDLRLQHAVSRDDLVALRWPALLSVARLRRVVGCAPRRSALESLQAYVNAHFLFRDFDPDRPTHNLKQLRRRMQRPAPAAPPPP